MNATQLYAVIALSVSDGLTLRAIGDAPAMAQAVRDAQGQGILVEPVEVRNPSERSGYCSAAPRGTSVALLGYPVGGWKVYGPFLTATEAYDFGSEAGEDDECVVLTMNC
jgi:hypothetical protein